jgi:peptidyl-tRNA hydrolase
MVEDGYLCISVYLLMCGYLVTIVNDSYCVVSSDWVVVHDELEMMLKEAGMA